MDCVSFKQREIVKNGNSTRTVDDRVQAMGMSGICKSQVSRVREETADRLEPHRSRHRRGNYPCRPARLDMGIR